MSAFAAAVILFCLGLSAVALVQCLREPRPQGDRWLWCAVILVFPLGGPLFYWACGRGNGGWI